MKREIRQEIERYLNGQQPLLALETWMVVNSQAIMDSTDKEAIEMANTIDADIIQLGEGIIDQMTLLDHLQYISSQYDTVHLTWNN